jgi:hypothetical protein
LPSAVPLEVSTVGDCRITKKNNPFCEPMCTGGTVCDNNGGQSEVGRCVNEPLRQNLGNVFVDGLSQPIVMKPDVNNSYSDDSLPYPGFEPGSEIKLAAIGADIEGFVLYGRGVEPLLVPNSDWQLIPHQELTINWTPGTAQYATISAAINIDQHGTSSASIRCEAPDTDTLVVPQELIDELYSLGTSGAPSGALIRHTVDSVETDLGCIEFEVSFRSTVQVSAVTQP